jgi:TolB-like protein
VLRSGDHVRINVQLKATGYQRIWGQTYEHDVQDVLALW